MWDAVEYVTGFASLAAFVAAGLFTYLNYRARQKTKWIGHIPDWDKARALDAVLDRFHVDTAHLSREQKFEIAMAQINNARRNYRLLMGLCALIATLFTLLWFVSMRQDRPTPQLFSFEGFVMYDNAAGKGEHSAPVFEA